MTNKRFMFSNLLKLFIENICIHKQYIPDITLSNYCYECRVPRDINLFLINKTSILATWHNPDHFCKCKTDRNGTNSELCSESLYPSVNCVNNRFESVRTECRDAVRTGRYVVDMPVRKVSTNVVTKVCVFQVLNFLK